ncbi:MAG TPA: MoxR family ATPase [Actinophytocola sp.]|uniref:AAA family ATPase n=1 Tax=Actinophytocola sp. TaxID=1872138 RepID=UPI002DBFFAB5|nr:MoxR family ATPase [Actinophytocola sp.]HEU5469950.1 MoxR family ATPase [Actinophytocola sp.]
MNPVDQRTASAAEIGAEAGTVLDALATVIVGRQRTTRLAMAALLAGGNVLLEDVPGLGKTRMARGLAQALGLDFRRLQCTPDLQPADVTGSFLYDPDKREFTFRPGPVFTGLLLADEINRTPPKTQSALLEAMQERQVTVEGRTFELPAPFHVLATANPIEYEGTYPLPEAQLDRFLLRLDVGYPPVEEEVEVLRRRLARRTEEVELAPVIDADRLRALQQGVERLDVDPDVVRYCVDLAVATRTHRAVEVGASPRGSQALLLVARALAVLDGRDFVLPEDVKECAVAALAHRLTLRAETWSSGITGVEVVTELLGTVSGPASARAQS